MVRGRSRGAAHDEALVAGLVGGVEGGIGKRGVWDDEAQAGRIRAGLADGDELGEHGIGIRHGLIEADPHLAGAGLDGQARLRGLDERVVAAGGITGDGDDIGRAGPRGEGNMVRGDHDGVIGGAVLDQRGRGSKQVKH